MHGVSPALILPCVISFRSGCWWSPGRASSPGPGWLAGPAGCRCSFQPGHKAQGCKIKQTAWKVSLAWKRARGNLVCGAERKQVKLPKAAAGGFKDSGRKTEAPWMWLRSFFFCFDSDSSSSPGRPRACTVQRRIFNQVTRPAVSYFYL